MNANSQNVQIIIMKGHLKWRIINSANGENENPH
nr:MAG TPA: hypothetical protein [Caudoviricetes sp.]